MASRERKLEILFVLFLQSAIWLLSTSLPAKSAQRSVWDYDWDWYHRSTTTRRPYWDRYTSSPDTYGHSSRSSASDPMFWIIFIGGILLGLLVLLLKYICKCTDSSTSESSATLHPPPARTIRPPNRSRQSFGSQNTRNSNVFSTGTINSFSTQNNAAASRTYNAGDKPPGYFDVVTPFDNGKAEFPEVSPRPLETPPPKYEDGSLPRY